MKTLVRDYRGYRVVVEKTKWAVSATVDGLLEFTLDLDAAILTMEQVAKLAEAFVDLMILRRMAA